MISVQRNEDMTENGIVLVVSVTLVQGDQVLIIQENKPSVRDTWNFPGGRIEPGEAVLEAAIREVKEETGYDVQLTGTTGVYQFLSSLNNHVIMFHFTGEVVGGSLQLGTGEIKDAIWVTLPDILADHSITFRDAEAMRQIVENLMNGVQHSLALFHPSLLLTSGSSHIHNS
ncbi:NUDIX hydrolase [Paenibacillus sp. 2KB_20]|uniref:NUDIX hydrolase n=1 Tax=Paenibacillus sp. 2KB_20 TaxID=3232977 RepID=UPI003F95300F